MSETSSVAAIVNDETDYHTYLQRLQQRFDSTVIRRIGSGEDEKWEVEPLFTTDVQNLFDVFLGGLPENVRQHYTCRTCRNFVERFGGLVIIQANGVLESALWVTSDAPEFLQNAIDAMRRAVILSNVTGVFYADDRHLGMKENVGKDGTRWQHLYITVNKSHIASSIIKTAFQQIAEKQQDYETVMRALGEFTPDHVNLAISILSIGNALYRSEKCLGQAVWLKNLYDIKEATKNQNLRRNLMWYQIALAPAGFCHPRSSMIGTLLEDLQAGMAFEQVKQRFDAKMNPVVYQRPQAAPSAGNLKQAEEIVQKLGTADSLRRRFARMEDLRLLWKPKVQQEKDSGSVFGHLAAKDKQTPTAVTLPSQAMTWEKFEREVLPDAEEITFTVPYSSHAAYSCLVTAATPESKPILQWDSEEVRNPVSWYFKEGGISPAHFNLNPGTQVKVTGICYKPTMWNNPEKFKHFGRGTILILEGAKDKTNPNYCLFPEILKTEYHGIRQAIEALSKSKKLEGFEEASACGLHLSDNEPQWKDVNIQVKTNKGMTMKIKLDRWN